MPKFTHFNYLEITKNEQELKSLLSEKKKEKMYAPKQTTIDNILNYSKALSIRKSEHLDFIEFILN
tara:strand:+ start:1510 stop:1707 length:198 start_codon:yes stop_codon:yes gene_type:complete